MPQISRVRQSLTRNLIEIVMLHPKFAQDVDPAALHAAAALVHHHILKDRTLARMLPGRR